MNLMSFYAAKTAHFSPLLYRKCYECLFLVLIDTYGFSASQISLSSNLPISAAAIALLQVSETLIERLLSANLLPASPAQLSALVLIALAFPDIR